MEEFKYMSKTVVCNTCGHEFEGPVLHEAVQSDERGVLNYVPARRGTTGLTCLLCNSELIRVKHDS